MHVNSLKDILKDNSVPESNSKLFNFTEESKSANFYKKQFSSSGNEMKEENPDFSKVPQEMNELISFLKTNVSDDSLIIELGGSRYQHRSGYPNFYFKNYIPLDISYTSIKAYVDMYNKYGIVADACKLPFKNNSIDVIFTHTFLEHPLKPENVLKEIDRVLKPGGYVIHSDAWNCRWWQCYGIVGIKKNRPLTIKEATIIILAKITEFKLIRLPFIVLKRLYRLTFFSYKKHINLKYKKLNPNYDLHLYSDEDAASSIDPVNVMLFYESRNYKNIPQLTFIQKLFFKHPTLFFQKSN